MRVDNVLLGVIAGHRRGQVCDASYSSVVLFGPFEGANNSTTIPEEISGSNFGVTGNAKLSTVELPFGASSVAFDGSGDYLTEALTDWNIYSDPYTIDVWIYPTNLAAGTQGIVSNDIQASSVEWNYYTYIGAVGNAAIIGRGGLTLGTGAGVIVQDTWTHVAWTGDGAGTHRIFVNGIFQAAASSSSYTTNTPGTVVIGAHNPNFTDSAFFRFFNGYLKCPRITVGVNRYPGTTSFEPPDSMAEYEACP